MGGCAAWAAASFLGVGEFDPLCHGVVVWLMWYFYACLFASVTAVVLIIDIDMVVE